MLEIKINAGDPAAWRRAAIIATVVGLALWMAYLVREIWIPMLVAIVIAMVLDPVVDRLERRGWSRLRGTLTVFIVFFAILGTAGSFIVPVVTSQTMVVTQSIGRYLPSGENKTQARRSLHAAMLRYRISPTAELTVYRAIDEINDRVNKSSAWMGVEAQSILTNLLWLVIIPVVAFYALKDYHFIYARVLLMVPRANRTVAQNMINEIAAIFVGYLRGTAIVCLLNAAATAALLVIFRVPGALAIGAIAGVLYVVPYLGPVFTYAITAGTCLTAASFTVETTLIIIGCLIVLHSILFDQIISPRIVGRHVGLHPILSIVALLMGGVLLGIVGIVLAVPFAGVIQMVLMVVFPKLRQPIEVPSFETIHARADELRRDSPQAEEAKPSDVAHQTIVDAVDSAEEQASLIEHPIGDSETRAAATAAAANAAILAVKQAQTTGP